MGNFSLDIDVTARKIRSEYNIETYGIPDIFSLAEKMDIYMIRIPLGKDTVCGFSTVYEGKKVIVSNSSEILSREIFTVAHEIGHCVYDLNLEEQSLIIDQEIDAGSEDYIEKRADYFASVLLLPEEEIRKYIKYELGKESREIIAVDIVRMQMEFNASFAAIVMRLFKLRMINGELKNKLFLERDSQTSRNLFKAMSLSDDLISATEILKVPNKYYKYIFSNYENGYIIFDKMAEALKLVGFDMEGIRKIDDEEKEKEIEMDSIDIDDLLDGF